MAKYLIQKPSGHIYVATPILEKRKDMYPYEPKEQMTEEKSQPNLDEQTDTEQTEQKKLQDLRQQHKQKFGRLPPPKAKTETIRAKINSEV